MERPWSLFLEELTDMGFDQSKAARALVATHNTGIEPAVAWLIEHAEDTDQGAGLGGLMASYEGPSGSSNLVVGVPSDLGDLPRVINPDQSEAAATVAGVAECKVVLVVAARLGMSPGKVGAQCAHAAVGLYRRLLGQRVPWLTAWEGSGGKTVVLQVETSEDLQQLQETASVLHLPSHLVRVTLQQLHTTAARV
ncbi:hypothetical protein N2152v2_001943 [Parachlorella kessleri]